MNYLGIFQTIITWGFYLLFFTVPLIFTSKSSELFEFNKMMVVYAATVVIVAAWIGKMVIAKKIIYRPSFMAIPLLLYLASHVISAIFSLDTRTSIFGYYSRFHEGLLATISYLLLYFAAVSNLNAKNVKVILYSSLASGIIIAVWGTFEHYGRSFSCVFVTGNFDVACWVQDVKNRVYATLGQPNWMAAYLDVLILTSFAFITKRKNVMLNLFQHLVPALFFAALLFTKSRSGVWGLIVGLGVFFIFYAIRNLKNLKILLVTCILFLGISVFYGLPLPKIDGKSIESYLNTKTVTTPNSELQTPNSNAGYIDIGISTSSDIRKVVWEGAVKIWQRYPVFGSGVETFAYSYYKDRPAAHNMLSEWDFLYNKAHNEYLNLLATTGTVGIIAYLFVIASVAWQSFKWFKIASSPGRDRDPRNDTLIMSLFAAWITILITNFFGFSVVVIGLFFFLIPAFSYIISIDESSHKIMSNDKLSVNNGQWVIISAIFIVVIYLEIKLLNLWLADSSYGLGQNLNRIGQPVMAFKELQVAVSKVPEEPLYRDELAQNVTTLALAAAEQNDATLSSQLANIALQSSDTVVADSPANVIFWKNRARVLYSLSTLDQKTLAPALTAILKAVDLAPTDAKVHYFAGLLLDANGQKEKEIKMLEETVALKIDYRDARFQLAKVYLEVGDNVKAKEQADFILTRLGNDEEVRTWLTENNL